MIDGKLTGMDKEPQNVQVVIPDLEEGGVKWLGLQDETGVFLRTADEPPPDPSHREDKTGVFLRTADEPPPDPAHCEDESGGAETDESTSVTMESLLESLGEAKEEQVRL